MRSNRRRARNRAPFVDDPDDRIGQTVAFVPPVAEELTDEDPRGWRGFHRRFRVIVLCDVQELRISNRRVLFIPVGNVMSRLHEVVRCARAERLARRPTATIEV